MLIALALAIGLFAGPVRADHDPRTANLDPCCWPQWPFTVFNLDGSTVNGYCTFRDGSRVPPAQQGCVARQPGEKPDDGVRTADRSARDRAVGDRRVSVADWVTPTPTPQPAIQPTVAPIVQPAATMVPTPTAIPQVAIDLAQHDPRVRGFAWNTTTREVHTIQERYLINTAETIQEAVCVARQWWHRARPLEWPLPCEALDLGEHGCPGWLWSGDYLVVHPIAADNPNPALGPAYSAAEALVLVERWLRENEG